MYPSCNAIFCPEDLLTIQEAEETFVEAHKVLFSLAVRLGNNPPEMVY